MKPATDSRIDAYIAKKAEFARPILAHLRALVHKGCPAAEETIRWGMPSFTYSGSILCGFAAFKAHCAFFFWHQGMKKVVGPNGGDAMGSMGRITSRADLPDDKTMLGFIRKAAELNASGAPARAKTKARKPLPMPADFTAALAKNRTAAKAFEGFAPGQRREYVEWITEAKREETRQKRLVTAIGWIAEGKKRNWQYENC